MEFIETVNFTRRIRELLTDDEYSHLQAALSEAPDLGDVIKGSSGLRKMRWALHSRGKGGGARVIYYWVTARDIILMLAAYPQSERDNLTPREIGILKRIVESEFS